MKKLFISAILLAPSLSFAFFCPGNFNQIDFGATIDQVNTACGKPDAVRKYTKQQDNMPQEWTYYIPQAVQQNMNTQSVGTMKVSVAFDAGGNAVNISVNGLGVGATSICGGSNIQLGESRTDIQTACGNPSFINKQNAPGTSVVGQGNTQTINVEEYDYKSNPPQTLVFEDGVLKSKK